MRQVDAAQVHQRARAGRRRDIWLDENNAGPGVDLNFLRRRVGIVFHNFDLFPHMTVLDNIALDPQGAQAAPSVR